MAALPDDKIDTSDIPEIQDWAGAQRGRFYRPGASHLLPIFVDAEIAELLADEAERRATDVSSLGNALLHRGIGMIASRKRQSVVLDSRYRDLNGEFRTKRGDTLVKTLRQEFGSQFAAGYRADTRLDTLLAKEGVRSLTEYLNHSAGGRAHPKKRA